MARVTQRRGQTPSVQVVRERIERAGGDPDAITIVAVVKGFDTETARTAALAGFVDLGENRMQPLIEKAAGLVDLGVRWHYVGEVQRNKVGELAPHVHLWHGVDRVEEAEAIAHRCPGAAVLVQVNTTAEPRKAGCAPQATAALVSELQALDLDVRGLMTIGPIGPPEAARPGFRELARLRDAAGVAELSMGMSGDLEVAIEEGATIVRIGTALFGPRPQA